MGSPFRQVEVGTTAFKICDDSWSSYKRLTIMLRQQVLLLNPGHGCFGVVSGGTP